MESWLISPRGEKRWAQGHPWVFSNEITNSLKAVQPGELVYLGNQRGQTLGLGYGNPHSLIAFRTLSRGTEKIDAAWMTRKLTEAAARRAHMGLEQFSHRLVFSEADSLPGLIIDLFKTADGGQVFVLEILTAGMENLLSSFDLSHVFSEFLNQAFAKGFRYAPWEKSSLVLKRDNSFRKMENIPQVDTEVVGAQDKGTLSRTDILVAQSLNRKESLTFTTDLIDGQKTGFFLDQRANIELLLRHLPQFENKTIRVLDLFSYVGQWSTQIANELKNRGYAVDVTMADASQKALDFACENAKPYSERAVGQKMDIVERAQDLPPQSFDIVICDPPALIKSKKDHPAGKSAYNKINSAAMRSLKPGGLFISCSCSQHLSDEDLIEVLTSAQNKSQRRLQWLAKGQQGPDHPMLLEFPQGTYLNSWLGSAQ